jgi:hypothetical protein
VARLAAVDAQTYWLSTKVPNDQFDLYVFDGSPPVEPALAQVMRRASVCHDLRLRILDDRATHYPQWVFGAVVPAQFVVHDGLDWASCLDAVAALFDHQLDPAEAAWRLHVFTPVDEVPGASGPATVVVLQISHALADGTRGAELAGWLFGRAAVVAPVVSPRPGNLLMRSVSAARAHRRLVHDTAAGLLEPAPRPRPALLTNSAPEGARRVRVLTRQGLTGQRAALGGPTVTVAVLTAVGAALTGYLRDRGEDVSQLCAEVPMAYSGIRHAHNHFRNVTVSLNPDLIASDLAAARARGEHASDVAARRALAAVPAPVLRWGVGKFDAGARSPTVSGHTVVTSVHRGPGDLSFGAAPVLFTAGPPALSPMMALVHGVHGIGGTVAISVHAAESAGDLDEYAARLDSALG